MVVETLNESLSFEEQIDEDLSELKKEIPGNQESFVPHKEDIAPVEKIGKNIVRFPYRSSDHECALILTKHGNMVHIKLDTSDKETQGYPTYMGEKMVNEFKDPAKNLLLTTGKTIHAKSLSEFKIGLGGVLDTIFTTSRISAPEKAEEAYALLFSGN